MRKQFDMKAVYESEIEPLMDKVHKLCIEYDIPMVALLTFKKDEHMVERQHYSCNKMRDKGISYINHFIKEDLSDMDIRSEIADEVADVLRGIMESKKAPKH